MYVFFPNSGHLMFSREFTFRLFKNYAYICSWVHVQGRHLKETVLWDNIAYGLKWENKNFKLKRSIRKGWWDNRAKGWRCMVTLKLFLSPLSKPYHHLLAGIRYQNSISTAGWKLRACLHGGGGPHLGEVTCGGSPHLSCKRNQNERICGQAGYPPKRVTSPSWGPSPPCKQALTQQ